MPVLNLLFSLLLFSHLALADTDDADSLDFESFHNDDQLSRQKVVNKNVVKVVMLADKLDVDTYRVSVSYDASDSLDVLKAQASLYQQMDMGCADGWVKKAEWANIKNGVRFLNNEFSCR
jgi:hypothetical protein